MNITLALNVTNTELQTTQAPTLRKMLSLGNTVVRETDLLEFIFNCFGLENDNEHNLPVAPIAALADLANHPGLIAEHKFWIRADPVFLRADLNNVLLFGPQHLRLDRETVERIFSLLNPFLLDEGLTLVCGQEPWRWYLGLEQDPMIKTTSLAEADGQNIQELLMRGEGRTRWLRLGNEIQMLLHGAAFNQQRQDTGAAPVNGVWFWGNGRLPDSDVMRSNCTYSSLSGGDISAQGLAKSVGIPFLTIDRADLETNIEQTSGDQLIILEKQEIGFGEKSLALYEQTIFQSLLRFIKKGRIKKLQLVMPDQTVVIRPIHQWRFWR